MSALDPDTIPDTILSELLSQRQMHRYLEYPPPEPILLWADATVSLTLSRGGMDLHDCGGNGASVL
jgi:hypothetical protein